MRKINREDMLELTRRMTPSRTSFTRVAGGYMEPDGEIDESFNVNFLNLSAERRYLLFLLAVLLCEFCQSRLLLLKQQEDK